MKTDFYDTHKNMAKPLDYIIYLLKNLLCPLNVLEEKKLNYMRKKKDFQKKHFTLVNLAEENIGAEIKSKSRKYALV